MDGPLEPRPEHDPAALRISDADRNKVAEILREAAGDGRIELAELDERLNATFAAKTYAELVPITVDLPAHPSDHPLAGPAAAAAGVPATSTSPERHLAIMSGFERGGHWVVPAEMTVVAVMGGAEIDMRDAQFATKEAVIRLNVVMGGVEIIVNPGTNVVIEGAGIMGGFAGPTSKIPTEITADSPIVRVKGFAIWGGVSVARKRSRKS